jgi:hypothetical protein
MGWFFDYKSSSPAGWSTAPHFGQVMKEVIKADGQFNRFYMLGLAKRARAEGIPYLELYRARERAKLDQNRKR